MTGLLSSVWVSILFNLWNLLHTAFNYLFLLYAAGCYTNGIGVTKDVVEAARLYTLAADHGFPPAQFCLGENYNGVFISKNYVLFCF